MSILVVKLGTEELCDESGRLDQTVFDDVAGQINAARKLGVQTIVVSSGAIRAGREQAAFAKLSPDLNKKEFAGIGSPYLLNRWIEAFVPRLISQVWVTHANWEDNSEKESIRRSLLDFLAWDVIPIVNENDVVSDKEISLMEKKISENDQLAKLIAVHVKANGLLILTKVGGVYAQDPKVNPEADFYEEIDAWKVPPTLNFSKAEQAAEAFRSGVQRVAIADLQEDVVIRFIRGEKVGTAISKNTRLKTP
jgi:glutamate 5-kinase